MRFARRLSAGAAFALAIASSVGVAAAQSGVCTGLEAQLASLDRGASTGSAANYRQYDASVARQRMELDRATAEARRAGCTGGFLIFRAKPEPKCGALMATINRMQANIQRLTASRDRFSTDPFQIARQRNDILRALAANQCGRGYVPVAGEQPRGFFGALFGQPRFRTWGEGEYSQNGQFGTFRTLCVRTCDGYYFPISFSTVPSQFGADEQTCRNMCPGADATLYTYRNPGEDTNAMVSLAGVPYTALPTAFRYRQEYDKACTCRSATSTALTALAPRGAIELVPATPVSTMPMPMARPAPGEDPETIANRSGRFTPRPVARANDPGVAALGLDGEKKVRIVGPSYYYGQ